MLSFSHEYLFQNPDVAFRYSHAGLCTSGVRIEIGGFESPIFLRVTIHVCGHGQHGAGMRPVVLGFRLCHPKQFTQRQGAGVDADDSGKLPDESPVSFSKASMRCSSSELSRCASAAVSAIDSSFHSFPRAFARSCRL